MSVLDQPRLLYSVLQHPTKPIIPYTLPWREVKHVRLFISVLESLNDGVKELCSVMQCKSSRRKQSVVVFGPRRINYVVLHGPGMRQNCQVLRQWMAAIPCAPKDGHTEALVTFWFWDQMFPVTLVIRSHFLQLTLESNQRNTGVLFLNMTTPTIFQITAFFRCLSVFNHRL